MQQVHLKTFDAVVVGDTTIVANRCEFAEFSQPYSDSGLQILVVYNKFRTSGRTWLFKKPFTTWTWVSTAAVNIYSGFVVWYIDRKSNQDFKGTWLNQCGTIIWLAFTTLFTSLQGLVSSLRHYIMHVTPRLAMSTFDHRKLKCVLIAGDKLHSNLSRMASVIWLFIALVITSSYIASLTSLLTL